MFYSERPVGSYFFDITTMLLSNTYTPLEAMNLSLVTELTFEGGYPGLRNETHAREANIKNPNIQDGKPFLFIGNPTDHYSAFGKNKATKAGVIVLKWCKPPHATSGKHIQANPALHAGEQIFKKRKTIVATLSFSFQNICYPACSAGLA